MKAVILAGGEGTRLRPLTYETPKQMLPIVGRPMLEWVVSHLAAHGISEVVLALGYLPHRVVNAYPDQMVCGVPVSYVVEQHPLDTAGGLRHAAAAAGINETFVAMNGDVMTDLDLAAMVHFHHQRPTDLTVAVRPVSDPSSFGVVDFASDGAVSTFVEKPAPGSTSSNHINAGVYVLEPSVLDRIEPSARVSLEREVFPLLARDRRIFAYPFDDYWIDTGTPTSYLRANMDVLEHRRTHSVSQFRDGSWHAPSCTVEDTALIVGSVLGPGVRVDSGAVIENSVLLEGATVLANATVRRSIIGPGAIVHGETSLDGAVVIAGSRESRTPIS